MVRMFKIHWGYPGRGELEALRHTDTHLGQVQVKCSVRRGHALSPHSRERVRPQNIGAELVWC